MMRDQAALMQAQIDLKRYQTLQAQDSIASQQVDTQAALVKQNEGVVRSDEASCESSEPSSGARPIYSILTRAVPAPLNASRSAAREETSITRPALYGPRSLTRTTTE